MSVLDAFERKHRFAVCVDSDGCAMDTMNIKHFRCFGPCMVAEWGLEQWQDAILRRWNEINLYTRTRGLIRFKGLAAALAEIDRQYTRIDGVALLADWADHAGELSNAAVAAQQEKHPIFGKALCWSRAVNQAIEALPQEAVAPFPGVAEALAMAHREADVAVVSSANPEAVREEWQRFGLLPHVDLLCTQELGSKAYCISRLREKGYDGILMCGDAPGDRKAAESNGVMFFPILVNHEAESWQAFMAEALPRFLHGGYAGAYQQQLLDAFDINLR